MPIADDLFYLSDDNIIMIENPKLDSPGCESDEIIFLSQNNPSTPPKNTLNTSSLPMLTQPLANTTLNTHFSRQYCNQSDRDDVDNFLSKMGFNSPKDPPSSKEQLLKPEEIHMNLKKQSALNYLLCNEQLDLVVEGSRAHWKVIGNKY